MTSLLNLCLDAQMPIKALSIEDKTWGEVDSSSDLELYNQPDFLQKNTNRGENKVYWLTGLSGVGKSTLAKALLDLFPEHQKPIWLDGDELRKVYGNAAGYSYEERKQIAFKNARLCEYLSSQGFNVICSTISLFNEVQEWNRIHISNYFEILLTAPIDVLKRRDPKKIYDKQTKGILDQVAGLDCSVEYPKNPDLVIKNDNTQPIKNLAQIIIDQGQKLKHLSF